MHGREKRLRLDGVHPLLVYVDDTNLLGENINTTKNTGNSLRRY